MYGSRLTAVTVEFATRTSCRLYAESYGPQGTARPTGAAPDKSVLNSAGCDALNNELDLQAGVADGSDGLGIKERRGRGSGRLYGTKRGNGWRLLIKDATAV